MKNFLIIIFSALSFSIYAGEIVPGKIIYDNKTIEVEFDVATIPISGDINFLRIQKGIKYRTGKTGEFIVLKPTEAKEVFFKLSGQEIEMISLPNNMTRKGKKSTGNPRIFLRNIIRNDKMSFFKYYHLSLDHTLTSFYWVGDEKPIFLKAGDEKCMKPRWIGYNKDMKAYFKDCPPVYSKITQGNFPWENAIDAVKLYNLKCGN